MKLLMKQSGLLVFVLLLCTVCFSQVLPTSLKITVRNELGNIEEGAKVQIFATDDDLRNGQNMIEEGITDKKGRITFKKLNPQAYYVNAEKGDKNNYGAGQLTSELQSGRINQVTIIIE